MLVLDDKWIWDFWIVRDGTEWNMFFLQAPKSIGDPELRHWNVSIGHAVSSDLRNWNCTGEVFGPSAGPAWDDFTTWTGSVVQDPDGLWHLFYTGTSRGENGLKQRIGRAVSKDLREWSRCGEGPVLDLSLDVYEEYAPGRWHDRAMRDPWVMRDPDGDGWIMYFTARAAGIEEANDAGAIGLARSQNLVSWTLDEPVHIGGFGQLEVPQVMNIQNRWYCLFCTAAEHWSEAYRASYPRAAVTGTHYLVSDSHLGPWEIAACEFLDGSAPPNRYAGKIIRNGMSMHYMGFLNFGSDGRFVGAISDPVPVEIGSEGRLALREPKS